MQNRFASLLIAALLPLLLFKWFVPPSTGQIDFWLIWVIAMVGVGLPLLYAEIGLAHRSRQIPAQGIQELTRQADTSTLWRSFVWFTVLLSLVIAALSIDAISGRVLTSLHQMNIGFDVPVFALAIVMVVIAGILSLLGSSTLIAAVGLITIAFVIGVLTQLSSLNLMMTEVTLEEWARGVVLALVSVGVGTGLYWFNNPLVSLNNATQTEAMSDNKIQKVATKTVLPIWMTQLIIGSVALIFSSSELPSIATLIYALGVLASAAFFMHYASTQVATRFGRFGLWIATAVSLIVTVLLVVIATPASLINILVAISLISGLIMAIFSGWQMKISHMRKSLNFKSEGFYNFWRVAIRILTPLMIVAAIVGWMASWFTA